MNAIERMARAICEAERMNPDDPLGGWRHWTEAARAALDTSFDIAAERLEGMSCNSTYRQALRKGAKMLRKKRFYELTNGAT